VICLVFKKSAYSTRTFDRQACLTRKNYAIRHKQDEEMQIAGYRTGIEYQDGEE